MAEVNPCTPPRRKSDVGPGRAWAQESASPAFSPLQRLRQGPTFHPPRRTSLSFHPRSFEAPVARPAGTATEGVAAAHGGNGREELTEGRDDLTQPALEQEIAGLQKALAVDSRQSREHFANRRRLHQLQNVQAKQVRPADAAPPEAADELEKVKVALEELRRGGEEEKIHRNQLEERVMREIEDLKSPTSPSMTPMALTRSLSRQNLLAEERERKRFWANEQLHAEVQELQDALAELRVTSADEMEAQRLKEHQVLAATAEMKEQLSLAPAREEALQVKLQEAEDRLQSEISEVQTLRRDLREQDEALASFWGLQSSYKREVAEASRFRETTCNLEEEIQSLSQAELRESSEADEEELRQQVETLKGRLLPLEEQSWLRERQDLELYQAVSSSLKQLPESFQEELGAPADFEATTATADDVGVVSGRSPASSDWCSSTIQKLANFASSVLQENAQLRWTLDLAGPAPRSVTTEVTSTGVGRRGAAGGAASPRSQASADEAGGHQVEVKGLNAKSTETEVGSETGMATETAAQEAAVSAVSAAEVSECAELREAEARAEARVKMLEKRLAKYEKSSPPNAMPNGSGPQGRLRSKLGPDSRRLTGPGLGPGGPGPTAAASPQKRRQSPREVKGSPREVPREEKNHANKSAAIALPAQAFQSTSSRAVSNGNAVSNANESGCGGQSRVTESGAVPSSCLYNSDSSSSGPPRAAYPPSPDCVSPEPASRWMGPFTEQQEAAEAEVADAQSSEMSEASMLRQKDGAASAPQSAADLFARAEALCESQHFAEAAELFRCVLAALRGSADRDAMRSVEAEVWAHLGVAMQSLDDIAAAIESYCQAIRMDPTLHVCYANLATLYIYLEDFQKAEEHVLKALDLEPQNEAYLEIEASVRRKAWRKT